jgi:uncharacterized HAD superfamily protein
MKIGIDLDEVLGHSLPELIAFHNHNYGTNLKTEDFTSYNFEKVWGGTLAEAIDKVEEFHKTQYFKNIKPMEGAKEVLEKLKKNNELFVITARRDNIRKETEEWVNKYYPNIFSKIYFTDEFSNASTKSTTKKKICDSLDIDIFIEDNIKYALECAGPKRKVYLLNYQWNQTKEKLPKNIIRVNSWKEIDIK